MSDARENDLVERLQRIDEEAMYRMPATTFTAVQDAIRTIERLQKELGEALNAVGIMTMRSGMHAEERDTIRQQTIEECAMVAEYHGESISNEEIGKACSRNIAKAIRSMDGGGK